jgi:hypothetical protein
MSSRILRAKRMECGARAQFTIGVASAGDGFKAVLGHRWSKIADDDEHHRRGTVCGKNLRPVARAIAIKIDCAIELDGVLVALRATC